MREEFDAFGYRFGTVGERFEALEESLDVIRRLFGGDPVTYDGPTVTLRDAVLAPAPERGPALWVGGKGGPRLLRLAARLADGWNVVWRVSPEAYVGKVSDVHAACDAIGRDPATFGLSVGLHSLIGEDEASAHAAFDRGRAAAPGDAMAADDYGSWRADTLSGTPDQILERVAAFESLGVGELIVSPWVLPFAIHEPDQVELFAERVIARDAWLVMEPRAAVLAVLTEEPSPLHWTRIQDLALRRGYLDPFAHPDVRRQVQTTLRALLREGVVAKAAKGVYFLAERAGRAGGLSPPLVRCAPPVRFRPVLFRPAVFRGRPRRFGAAADASPAILRGRPGRGRRAPATSSVTWAAQRSFA